jgi:glycine/D-amino acid oxidase-like deaminating enzyme
MAEYSAFSLLKNALSGNRDWKPAWRKPESEGLAMTSSIIGGGGHGLSTAYYLAKEHSASPMSPCSKRVISAPAMSAATPPPSVPTICCPQNTRFYEHSMEMWENLSHDLNYNVMFSQRGVPQPDAHARTAGRIYPASGNAHAPSRASIPN